MIVANMGTCEERYVGLVESVSVDLVDITQYLMGISGGTE